MVIICTTSLTFNNSTFCPHSVFVCFVWIWEQTSIISLNNINWLVFITETKCVYCAVGVRSATSFRKGSKPRRSDCQLQSDLDIWTVSKGVTNRMTGMILCRDTSMCTGEGGQQAYWLPRTATRRGDANEMFYENEGLLKNTVYCRRWSKWRRGFQNCWLRIDQESEIRLFFLV